MRTIDLAFRVIVALELKGIPTGKQIWKENIFSFQRWMRFAGYDKNIWFKIK